MLEAPSMPLWSPASLDLPMTRYSPGDFHRLANRTPPRRPSSPHFTPDFRVERAHEPPDAAVSARSAVEQPAECPSDDTLTFDATTRRSLRRSQCPPSTQIREIASPPASPLSLSSSATLISDKRAPVFSRASSTSNASSSSTSSCSSSRSNSSSSCSGTASRPRFVQGSDIFKHCVIEDDRGVAQSFLESGNVAIGPLEEPPLKDLPSPGSVGAGVGSAENCECRCRCGRSPKWRPLGGKRRSKSYTSLRTGISELSGWDLEVPQTQEPQVIDPSREDFGPGDSPLERLPAEILDDIVAQLALDLPPPGYGPRNVDLISCLLTSKTIHVATINTLYKHITIPHSSIFSKFLAHINEHPGLGTLVRRLDLSHFTSVGLGRSRQSNAEIENLTAKKLTRCLELTPAIQEVLLQENLDDDIDETVLRTIFFRLPQLRGVDFCAASSLSFVNAFSGLLDALPQSPGSGLAIKRLSLHECFTLPSSAFERLLPHLPQLTHLDVAHTRITDRALAAIPATAELSHLNLGRCISITGSGVVDVLTSHPALKSLVYLNLACDVSRYRLLWEADVDTLLPALPNTLRSLNLNGAQIGSRHIPYLRPLTRHLEELGISHAELSLADINALYKSPKSSSESEAPSDEDEQTSQPARDSSSPLPTLHYLDLTCIPSVTQTSLFTTPAPTNILLSPATLPLEVLELGDKAISSLRECRNTNKQLGWCVKELGRRGWYVRDLSSPSPSRSPSPSSSSSASSSVSSSSSRGTGEREQQQQQNGRRGWKMGAMWWGMRKCPVAFGEVGGLYGHYMFKK